MPIVLDEWVFLLTLGSSAPKALAEAREATEDAAKVVLRKSLLESWSLGFITANRGLNGRFQASPTFTKVSRKPSQLEEKKLREQMEELTAKQLALFVTPKLLALSMAKLPFLSTRPLPEAISSEEGNQKNA